MSSLPNERKTLRKAWGMIIGLSVALMGGLFWLIYGQAFENRGTEVVAFDSDLADLQCDHELSESSLHRPWNNECISASYHVASFFHVRGDGVFGFIFNGVWGVSLPAWTQRLRRRRQMAAWILLHGFDDAYSLMHGGGADGAWQFVFGVHEAISAASEVVSVHVSCVAYGVGDRDCYLLYAVYEMMVTAPPKIEPSWLEALRDEFQKPYMLQLKRFLLEEKKNHPVYPLGKNIFNAFWLTPFDKVKVVLLGQDPYHGRGQAHGLSFSVPEGTAPPPSLVNIFKEIESDLGHPPPVSGFLEPWAKQGVFLLNAVLTVRERTPGSHRNKGWESFTAQVISLLSAEREHLIFFLWGKYAQEKKVLIDPMKHLVLSAPHPSPYSADRGFFGCRHFSKANDYLTQHGREPIQWNLCGI